MHPQSDRPDFVPLTTDQGMDEHAFRTLVADRLIVIWGGGVLGKMLYRLLCAWGLGDRIYAFCDARALSCSFSSLPRQVLPPPDGIRLAQQSRAIVLLASETAAYAMASKCSAAGLTKNSDYLAYTHLRRPEAVVEISPPRRSPGIIPGLPAPSGLLSAERYYAILKKLLSDIPALFHIDFSGWGDPLDNPDLPEIVALTEPSVPCSVVTHLQDASLIPPLLTHPPTQIVVVASGYKEIHEQNCPDSDWATFARNLESLAATHTRLKADCEVRIRYDLYRNNGGAVLQGFRDWCAPLGIPIVATPGYFGPYDRLLSHMQLHDGVASGFTTAPAVTWSLPVATELAQGDRHLPCLCQRIFPIIKSSGAVSLCHVYNSPQVDADYQAQRYSDLLSSRHSHPHCRDCQSHSLHRLDIAVLERRHPDAKAVLLPQPYHA